MIITSLPAAGLKLDCRRHPHPDCRATVLLPPRTRTEIGSYSERAHLCPAQLGVGDLADVAHLSPRQFSRAFLTETGQTPAKAVENLRLEGARALLEDTNHAINVVANQTGFGDRNRMRRAFLRAYGQSPQALRRQSRGYMSTKESELSEA